MRMREQFEEQLELLHQEVTEMGNLCEQAIDLATKALLGGDEQLAKEVFRRDASIDARSGRLRISVCVCFSISSQWPEI